MVILALLVAELLVGSAVGVVIKFVVPRQAKHSESCQVIAARNYVSLKFGRNFPEYGFDPLSLPTNFVIVEKLDGLVVRERFYTFLGSCYEVVYKDGEYKEIQYSALSSPLYVCAVLLPTLIGFLAFVLPFVGGKCRYDSGSY